MSDGVDGPTPTSRRAARPGPFGSVPPGVVNATETGTYWSVVGSTGQESEKFGTGGTYPACGTPTVTVSRPSAPPSALSRKPSTTTRGPSAGGSSEGAGEATGILGGGSGSARSWRNPQPEVETTTAASSAHALRRPPARTAAPSEFRVGSVSQQNPMAEDHHSGVVGLRWCPDDPSTIGAPPCGVSSASCS